jgi:NCAIR mutase (PurE)-related protein
VTSTPADRSPDAGADEAQRLGGSRSAGGLAALLSMLNSCAPGVTVCNIDNGFGAGVFAARVARRAAVRP